MKWKISSMVDPGDGIVSVTTVEVDSDDVCDVAWMAYNGELTDEAGEMIGFIGWIFGVEALPLED